MVAGSRDSEDVAVVWSCLVVSVDRLSGFVWFGSIPSVVARFLHDRAVPDSPQHCVTDSEDCWCDITWMASNESV